MGHIRVILNCMYLTEIKPPKSPTWGTYALSYFSPPFGGMGGRKQGRNKELTLSRTEGHREEVRCENVSEEQKCDRTLSIKQY
jgi:hypothetical protein